MQSNTIDGEIDFRDLGILFLKRSWVLVLTISIAFLLGFYKVRKMPDMYSSTILLVPTNTATGGGRAQAAVAAMGGKAASSPELTLYSALMTSRTVMLQVLRSKVPARIDGTTMVLVASMRSVDTTDPVAMQIEAANLAKSVSFVDAGDGIIRVSFTTPERMFAPAMAELVLEKTQRELERIQSEKIATVLAKLRRTEAETYDAYRRAGARLGAFMDANRELELGQLQAQRSALESELSLRESAYTSARARAEEAQNQLDQIYPPAVVFDPASRPALRVGPDRRSIMIAYCFAGAVAGIVVLGLWQLLFPRRRQAPVAVSIREQ